MGVARYAAPRLAFAAITLVVISAITFFATNAIPTDPARIALGKNATTGQLTAYDHEQGLDRPVVQRYFTWVGGVLQGRWGTSVLSQEPVSQLVVPRIGRSVLLAAFGMLLAIPLAYLLGVYSAQHSGRASDRVISIWALFVNSLPEFVVAIILLMILAVGIRALPVESSGAAFDTGWGRIKAYILPVLTLAIVLTPYIARMVRANVRDVAGRPFVRSAVLRGVSRRRVTWRHVVPNASLPVVNVVALTTAELIGGVVIIETVFGFPGIGQLLVQAVESRDIPTVQVIVLIIAVGVVLINFCADLVVLMLNPRLRRARI
jgi:peptide/nickel transport system permease protein